MAKISSKEGVTQGDVLAMILYGLALLTIIKELKTNFLDLKQPWYADDAAATGKFQQIKDFVMELMEKGPKYGYYPEPEKSILVVHPSNVLYAKTFFEDLKFKIVTGTRYLGGFI